MAKSNYSNQAQGRILDDIFLFLHDSGICDKAIICGGYFLGKVLNSRATVDIDLNVQDPLVWEEFKTVASKCAEYLHKYDSSIYVDISEPTIDTTARVLFKNAFGEKVAGLDVGINHYDFGVMKSILPINTESGQVVRVQMDSYSYERVLADKLSVAFSIKNARRSKDFYDLYLILTTCELDYTLFMRLFYESSLAMHPEWVALYSPYNADRLMGLEKSWNKLILTNAVNREVLAKPSLYCILETLSNFIRLTHSCCMVCKYKWNPLEERWIQNG